MAGGHSDTAAGFPMTSDWHAFFAPYFETAAECASFVDRCEDINRDYRPHESLDDSTPKIMMHQTVRLVTLSDMVRALPGSYDPLGLFFLLICAECIAKLHAGVKQEVPSRHFVKRFFEQFISGADRALLLSQIRPVPDFGPFDLATVVGILYDIRCDVAHEGQYWGFSFPVNCPSVINLHPRHERGSKPICVSIRYPALRDMIVRGCIKAVRSHLSTWRPRADRCTTP